MAENNATKNPNDGIPGLRYIALCAVLAGLVMYFIGLPQVEIVLFLVFVFVLPPLLYCGIKYVIDPVPVWLLLLPAGVILALRFTGNLPGQMAAGDVLPSFIVILVLSTLAVLAPYPLFERRIRIKNPWKIVCPIAAVGVMLFFISTFGEIMVGRPQQAFSASLPLTGWIFDGLVSLLHIGDAVYPFASPLYYSLWMCGFYLEILIIAIVYYAVASRVYPEDKPQITP